MSSKLKCLTVNSSSSESERKKYSLRKRQPKPAPNSTEFCVKSSALRTHEFPTRSRKRFTRHRKVSSSSSSSSDSEDRRIPDIYRLIFHISWNTGWSNKFLTMRRARWEPTTSCSTVKLNVRSDRSWTPSIIRNLIDHTVVATWRESIFVFSKNAKSPHSKNEQRMKSGAGGSKIIPIGPETLDRKVRFNSIGGLDGHIQCLKEMILLPMMYPEVFAQFQIQPPRGVLFHGPPGELLF